MRRKWIAPLALLLVVLLPCAALAAPGDANIAQYDEMRETYSDFAMGACALGDTLYLNGSEHIFRYRVGDGELTAMELELPEPGEGESRETVKLFSDGEGLYLLSSVYRSTEDSYGIDRLEILPLELDGEVARAGEPVEVNIDELTTDYGGDLDSTYLVQINEACYAGGYLMLNVYDASYRMCIYALDVSSGEGGYVEGPEEWGSMTAYEDGKLLVAAPSYSDRTVEFLIYDPASETLSSACAPIDMGDDGSLETFEGLAYDPESGRLFYLSGGYVMAMEGFDYASAQPVAELSIYYSSQGQGGQLLPGGYYVHYNAESTAIRCIEPGALPETRLVVRGSDYGRASMNAYYDFENAHPDVALVMDPDYANPEALIEGMMNRDDAVDVYVISVSGAGFDALYNRGYMVELDDEAILSAVGEMYPAIQEVLVRDGSVVAVPVSLYGWIQGLDYEGFEKIGIPREEAPTTWKGLLELLPQLPAMLPEDGSVRIFNEYSTQGSVRSQLLNGIMESWRVELTASGQDLYYDDPALIELMEMALSLDLEALGLPEDDEDEGYSYTVSVGGERSYQLIEFSTGCTIGNFYSNAEPVLLSAVPGSEGYIPLSLSVAFVNPFSKHADLAQEYLAALLGNLDVQTVYNLSDKYNEPVRNEDMLAYLEEAQKAIDDLNAELETADPVDRPALEEALANQESALAEMERYSWTVSAQDIEWYRGHADRLTVQRFDYINAADEDGELSDMAEQLLAGRLSPAEFLKEVDRKVRMRQMEGN